MQCTGAALSVTMIWCWWRHDDTTSSLWSRKPTSRRGWLTPLNYVTTEEVRCSAMFSMNVGRCPTRLRRPRAHRASALKWSICWLLGRMTKREFELNWIGMDSAKGHTLNHIHFFSCRSVHPFLWHASSVCSNRIPGKAVTASLILP